MDLCARRIVKFRSTFASPGRRSVLWAICVLASVGATATGGASTGVAADHPIVAGFERFYAQGAGDAAGGRLLLGELNCVACHSAAPEVRALLRPKQAPNLDGAGARLRPEYVRDYLLDPPATRPGGTMPHVLARLPEGERQQAADALTHYLALQGAPVHANAVRSQAVRGEKLFHSVGCVACHDPQRPDAKPLAGSIPLTHVSKKYALPGLAQFLAAPLAVRPSGRMPDLNLKPEEAREIASFLLKDLEFHNNLRYAYYEGTWDRLPDFAKLKPVSTGVTAGFDVNLGRPDNFALRFEGKIAIAKEGQYRFHLASDDGSRLFIDDQLVVNNDGIHPPKNELGRAFLKAGEHSVVIEFFEQGGGEELKVEYEGAGVPLQSLETALVTIDAGKKPGAPARFVVDPSLADQGREWYAKLQCGSCHTLKGAPTPANDVATPAAPSLASFGGKGGCLSEKPVGGAPHYRLSTVQRASIGAALAELKQAGAAAPAADATVSETLLAFNCYACHQRGDRGGVPDERNALFLSNQPEMGDEGRIPPPLNGVGAKLTRDWLKQVLENGTKDRPYMFTKMPKFGGANVGHLVDVLEKADPEPAFAKIDAGVTTGQLKSIGRRLVGSQGYSCIKCHTWGSTPATGIQSISMTTMARRLRPAWFHEYVLEPQRYRPGTRMPAAWPMGQSLLPNVLGGETPKQIHSVWSFLLDGDKAAMPQGLGRDPIELVAETEPVIYRNFIEGAGPRAIGVGYPEKANVAFDANDMRLALIWQGAFIDASRHWIDRGVGFQPPLGDNVIKLPAGASFAVLSDETAAWPDKPAKQAGLRFRGYRLDDKRRPTFFYGGEVFDVEDLPSGVEGDVKSGASPGLRRELTIVTKSSLPGLTYRAAAGGKIVAQDGGWYVVDDVLRVRLEGDSTGVKLRKSGDRFELLAPLPPGPGKTRLVQHYVW